MRILLTSLAAAGLALMSGAAFAATGDFGGVDTDRNGAVSWAEFNLVYTDIDEGSFNQADVNGDGSLSIDEFDGLALSTGSILPSAPAASPLSPAPESLTHVNPADQSN